MTQKKGPAILKSNHDQGLAQDLGPAHDMSFTFIIHFLNLQRLDLRCIHTGRFETRLSLTHSILAPPIGVGKNML